MRFTQMQLMIIIVMLLISLSGDFREAIGGEGAKDVRQPSTHRVRALHVVVNNVLPTDMRRLIDQARLNQFNVLILGLFNGVRLKTAPPPKEGIVSWSRDELRDVVRYARENGLDVIPEIKLLSHQEHFLARAKPNLLFNATTYDPRKPEVYEIVFSVINEVIELVQPKAIHIGHDEVAGFSAYTRRKWLGSGEMLPAELFLEDVQRINAYLKKRGVETWMWGDMLISPKEFPGIRPNPMHGTTRGYGKELREKLPKDIVICDWHYEQEEPDFPSLATFKAEGFRVLGATFERSETIKNFSRYAYTHGAEGMIATIWFHVQRKEWDIVDDIIKTSGEAFWNAK